MIAVNLRSFCMTTDAGLLRCKPDAAPDMASVLTFGYQLRPSSFVCVKRSCAASITFGRYGRRHQHATTTTTTTTTKATAWRTRVVSTRGSQVPTVGPTMTRRAIQANTALVLGTWQLLSRPCSARQLAGLAGPLESVTITHPSR
eukprot:1191284-Prorocentrum_minimum.AAC.2